MNLLHLDASALGSHSVSRQLSAEIVDALHRTYPVAHVDYRDLATDPIPHWQPVVDASREPDAVGQRIVDQFMTADIVVIGAPMYNFGISSQLKAWIDHIAVPGQTFSYSENGPQGLAGGKRVIVASSRGGIYSEGPAAAMDFQENYLHTFFGFIGVQNLEIIRAEGVAISEKNRAKAFGQARDNIRNLSRKAA